jgi:hypothetical protein
MHKKFLNVYCMSQETKVNPLFLIRSVCVVYSKNQGNLFFTEKSSVFTRTWEST